MSRVSEFKFERKKEDIKRNVLFDLNEYFSDPEEWKRVSDDLVSFAIFYDNSFDNLIIATLLYKYDPVCFIKKYLVSPTNAKLDQDGLQRHHYRILAEYAIDRAAVGLILNGVCEVSNLVDATRFNYLYLKEVGYENEVDLIDEVEVESMLSFLVPQMIVNLILKVDYSRVVGKIDPSLKSKARIWMYAWQLIYAIYNGSNKDWHVCWRNLVKEWKSCLVKSDFYSFHIGNLVLLYYIYCEACGVGFNIRDLSNQICSD